MYLKNYQNKKKITKNNMDETTSVGKIIGWSIFGIIVVAALISSIVTVPSGFRGVVTRFGAVTGGVMQPGLHFKTPFITGVTTMDVQTQKEQVDAAAASQDLQTVDSTVAVNYALDPNQLVGLYTKLGTDYKARVIDPAIQESVKSVTANYNAEELISKREEVALAIQNNLSGILAPQGINVLNFSVVNFNFSQQFNDAVEAKVTAQQDALAAQNKLQQVQFEAQQAVAKAQGDAQAIKIEATALAQNPQVIQYQAVQKWDGVLPQATSGVPFINLLPTK